MEVGFGIHRYRRPRCRILFAHGIWRDVLCDEIIVNAAASAVASSFQQTKQLRVKLILARPGQSFSSGGNTLVLTMLRMVAVIQGVVRFANQLDLKIYGMLQADMNALTVVRFGQNVATLPNNIVQLEANGGNGWQMIFAGTIIEATPEYREAPDVFFHLQARFGYYAGVSPAQALSYANGVSAATAAQAIATSMGFGFQNNGVTAQLSAGSYFPAAPWDQLNAVATAADFDYYTEIQSQQPTIVICPKNTARQNTPTIQLTPQSGLIGYPRIEVGGIAFECLYNPSILAAGLVQISGSDVPAANGIWMPYTLLHQLEAVKPGGAWFTSVHCLWQPQ